MIEHTYQVLEYDRLLEILSRYASCPLGQAACLSFNPSNDTQWIASELGLVSEARLLLKVRGLFSFADLTDLTPLLGRTRVKGSYLEAEDLLVIGVLVESGQAVRSFLRSEKSLIPALAGIIEGMPDFGPLMPQLKGAIAPNGEIRDNATPALARIRQQRRRHRSQLEKKLNDLQMTKGLGGQGDGHLVTVRDGRYVIPVKSDQKSLVSGIVHDYSRSRSTCFVEPMEVIEDNNRSAELALEESAEEQRILLDLTRMVGDLATEILHAQTLIARLDGIFARARYGEDFSCVPPEIDETHGVKLRKARNPILLALSRAPEKGRGHGPVPVDIELRRDRNILIVSGPNRGGKTVTLKTLGLLTLMAQAGIPIPAAEGSCLPVFDHWAADIGDEQDIQTGMSTFSAHAENLKRIIELAGPRSLVIIDEPGMGTDPNEGAALTMAVLDELSQQNAFVALATHLNRLKAYGLLNHRVVNAAVEFDATCNRPTFRLRYGSPGISHALETARELGMSAVVLRRAEGYLDPDDVQLNRLIDKMGRLTVEVETAKEEAELAKQGHDAAAEELRAQMVRFETEKQAFMEKYRIDAETAIRSAREKLKQAINLLKTKKEAVQAQVVKQCDAVSRDLLARVVPSDDIAASPSVETWRTGQGVFHTRLKQHGIIQSIDPSGGRVQVMLGAVKVLADPGDLQVTADRQETSSHRSSGSLLWTGKVTSPWKSSSGCSTTTELNVVGYHVDEAIPLIDRAVDRALLEGRMSLTIVHGHGTGRLRGAIRDHLRGLPFVRTVSGADPRSGGDAITVAEIG